MAKDIKLYKDGHEVTINETQLDNFLELGYKQEKDKQVKSKKKEENKWQHITEQKDRDWETLKGVNCNFVSIFI